MGFNINLNYALPLSFAFNAELALYSTLVFLLWIADHPYVSVNIPLSKSLLYPLHKFQNLSSLPEGQKKPNSITTGNFIVFWQQFQ